MLRRAVRLLPSFLVPLAAAWAVPAASAQTWQSGQSSPAAAAPAEQETVLPEASAALRITLAKLDAVDWSGWQSLDQLLTDIHERTGVPALAAAIVQNGRIVAHATIGVRAFGSPEPVGADDCFHLGSVTKSLTATLLGKLVEQRVLRWNTTVGEALPDVEMRDEYRSVTLEQLLHHRGGLPAYTDGPPPGAPDLPPMAGTPRERRAAFVAHVLSFPPVGTPAVSAQYSNVGYALAGHMAEQVTGQSWEQLMQEQIFDSIGMDSAGFGFPSEPMGHVGDGPEFRPVPLDAYPPMARIAPAGNIHCSVADLARYAKLHLDGLGEKDGALRWETIKRLHAVGPEDSEMRYACGWFVTNGATADPIHSHGGTVGASFAEVKLYPARRAGVVFLTSVGQGLGETIANKVARALLDRYRDNPSSQTQLLVERVSTAEDDDAFWHIIEAMSQAINNEDREAYSALFAASHPKDDRDSVFDFMTNSVVPKRGGIRCFHAASRLTGLPNSKRAMRAVTFHLENGFPGYFGISLDEAGKVAEFSLFVKGDICRNGADRECADVVRQLGEGK